MNRPGRVTLVVVVASLLLTVPALGDGDSRATVSGFSPTDVDHGETTQTIHFGGRLPVGEAELTVDLTPLARAGVDLSDASVAVNRSTPDLHADPSIERVGNRTVVQTTLNATDEPTGFRLALQLHGLDTSNAGQEWLHYEGKLGDKPIESNRFRLESPSMPDVGATISSAPLVAGRADVSQDVRLSVFDASPDTAVTLSVDTTPLQDANASLAAVAADARVVEGDLTLDGVTRTESTIELHGRTGTADRSSVVLELSGIDTRGSAPTEDLQHPITIDALAGPKTIGSESFGIHRPSDVPTETTTIVESPTETETSAPADSPTPTSSPSAGASGPAGFTALPALVALLLGTLVLLRVRS